MPIRTVVSRYARLGAAGVAVAAMPGVARAQTPAPATWKLVEELRLGADDGPASFEEIHAVVATRAGNIFVLDHKAQELRVFDAAGRFLRRAARRGHGPGEISVGNGMAVRADDVVWVSDPENQRFSLYRADGTYLRQVEIAIAGYGDYWEGTMHRDGRLIDLPVRRPAGGVDPITKYPVTVDHLRYLCGDGRADTTTFPTCGAEAPSFVFRTRSGYATSLRVPFAPSLMRVVTRDGGVWCSASVRYELSFAPPGGAMKRVVARAVEPVRLAERERADLVSSVREFERKRGPMIHGDLAMLPKSKPVVEQLLADDAGRVWVRRSDSVAVFDVFEPSGKHVARLLDATRVDDRAFITGDRVYTIRRDADDVASVVRYRIVR